MDEAGHEVLESIIADLMVFYKGAISLHEFEHMPIPKILDFQRYAQRINEAREREIKKG